MVETTKRPVRGMLNEREGYHNRSKRQLGKQLFEELNSEEYDIYPFDKSY